MNHAKSVVFLFLKLKKCYNYFYIVTKRVFKSLLNKSFNQNQSIMKKTIIMLGLALVAFANVSFATNVQTLSTSKESIFNTPSPLCNAIIKGDMETVKKFVEYGSDVNENFNGITPLMLAARYNRVEIIKYLLDNGAKLNTMDEYGHSALYYAESSKSIDAIAVLK